MHLCARIHQHARGCVADARTHTRDHDIPAGVGEGIVHSRHSSIPDPGILAGKMHKTKDIIVA
jgi:hypothetical protein